MARKNARIDSHILDLFFEGRLNPMPKLPKDATPAEVHAWFKVGEHRTLAVAARRRAHYDVEEAGVAEYHDAEVARLEAELAAGRGRKKRKNPAPAAPDTEAFRRWFGDSKVVDAQGEPLVVYHGTDKGGFYEFDPYASKGGRGVFFTSDFGMARSYVRGSPAKADPTPPLYTSWKDFLSNHDEEHLAVEEEGGLYSVWDDGYAVLRDFDPEEDDEEDALDALNRVTTKKKGVYAVYLRIQDPMEVDAKGANWDEIPIEGEDEDGNPQTQTYSTNDLALMALDMECDGLIIRNVTDAGGGGHGMESGDVFVVFNANQVKSAERNVGTFDPDTDDIRKNPPRRRRNPTRADRADEVDDWVTIEECGCHACAPARMNPRAAKRTATGAYADLDSVTLVITNALANYGLSMSNILAVKFTRGGKSRGGACSYSRSLNKCQIMFNGLAWPAFTEAQRLNTVLHEAAHAIQFLTTGNSDHGPKWQKIAQSIGCSGDSCMTLEASQAMVDAYAEAKGLEKRKIITREDAEAARSEFKVGDYVSFDHKRERWFGKIVSRGPMHATVMIQSHRQGITGKIPYPSLQKEAPPLHAEKVAGVRLNPRPDGEAIAAWCDSNESYAVLDRTASAGSSWMAGACVLLAKALRKRYPEAKLVGIETDGRIQHVGARIGETVYDALGEHDPHTWVRDWLTYEQLPARTLARVVGLTGVPRSAMPDAESPATPADVALVSRSLP